MHAAAVVAEDRFRHESYRFIVPFADVTQYVFVILHVVGHAFEGSESNVDLGLTGSRDLVMLALDRYACFLQLQTHFVANVLQRVHWRHRKVTFFRSNLVTEIWKFFAAAVPMSLTAIDDIRRRVPGIRKSHIVENKKFRFRSEERRVGDAGRFQICFCFFGHAARVAIVWLAGDWVDNCAD